MKNLYVVAIGGSGERVMRSLIMLLTSGVQVKAQRVIPVFIENDVESAALHSCLRLLKYYHNNQADANSPGVGVNTLYNQQLGADQQLWPSFCGATIAEPIILNQAGDTIGTLADVIGNYDASQSIYKRMNEERDLLFTSEDLQMPLTVGFVGNPNIGSIVLNSHSLSHQTFEDIKADLSSQDGLIVIGSLFGGTGAAGIPLVINSINELPQNNRPLLGTIAMLPYFVTNPGNTIANNVIDTTKYNVQSEAFDAKTRAALMYYAEYMRDMDCMYYVGDSKAKDMYAHCVGGKDQDNRAHIVELMSALSVVDFAKQQRGNNTTYKRPVWGINDQQDGNVRKLPTNVSGIRNKDLARALVKFRMMMQIFRDPDLLKRSINQKHPYATNIGFTEAMRNDVVQQNLANGNVSTWGLNNLLREWEMWMDQLGDDKAKRQFKIYNSTQVSTDKDLTSKFHSETGFGIAKTDFKRPTVFAPKVTVAMDADIQEYLSSAYDKLYPKGAKEDALKLTDNDRLPRLLQIISNALDEVLENRCSDEFKKL